MPWITLGLPAVLDRREAGYALRWGDLGQPASGVNAGLRGRVASGGPVTARGYLLRYPRNHS